ncbi:hypothetical protein PRIPAC_95405 [Pristionchus pacificus]|nr:hypothetical protein PRIPAC_95405 [Pristionchus pacificus]
METFGRWKIMASETFREQISIDGNARTGSVVMDRIHRSSTIALSKQMDNNNHPPCRKISRSLPLPVFTVIVSEAGESILTEDPPSIDITQSEEEYHQYNGVDINLRRESDRSKRSTQEDFCEVDILNVPDSLDWRDYGMVPPIKNQVRCGSCWAFAAIGSLESIARIKYNNTKNNFTLLSEQQLVDCSRQSLNDACSGGWPQYAYEYMVAAPGISAAKDYPYTGVESKCAYQPSMNAQPIVKAIEIPKWDEEAMKVTLATVGPIAVAIDAESLGSFRSYKSGVYDDPNCRQEVFTHAVVIVGYGTDEKAGDYWIIRNSWGVGWGDGGYFNIARGKNMCGIAKWPAYPGLSFERRRCTQAAVRRASDS